MHVKIFHGKKNSARLITERIWNIKSFGLYTLKYVYRRATSKLSVPTFEERNDIQTFARNSRNANKNRSFGGYINAALERHDHYQQSSNSQIITRKSLKQTCTLQA
jgi:hypothetical protein